LRNCVDTSNPDIPGIFRRALGQRSGKPFIVFGGHALTYGELRRTIGLYASYFDRAGVKAGDRIVFSSKNEAFVCTFYVSLLANGIASVLIDPDSGTERAGAIVEQCRPRFVFADEELINRWRLVPASSRNVISIPKGDGNRGAAVPWQGGLDADFPPAGTITAEAFGPAKRIDPCSDAYVLYTSGTTSAPKGVRISYRALFSHLDTLSRVYRLDDRSRILNNLILSHADGMVQGPLLALFSQSTLYRPFPFAIQKIEDTFDLIYREQITHWILVPTMLALTVRFKQDDHDTLDSGKFKYIVSCGDSLESALWSRAENRFKTRIINGYGLTETVAGGLFAGPDEASHVIGTVGVPVDCEAKIFNETGAEAPAGEPGELRIRGSLLMSGYFDAPHATREAFYGDWLKTGDIGYLGTDGCFRIMGRKKSIIISGGLNISPEEVEEVLRQAPGVEEVVAFGIPDAVWGEIVACAVSGGTLGTPREEEIIGHCRLHLEERKVPSEVYILDALPRGRSGKIMMPELRERIKTLRPVRPAVGGDLPAFLSTASQSLQLPPERVHLQMTVEGTPAWDSLSHLVLIAALENRFQIAFTAIEVMNARKLSDLYELIQMKVKP
jgi:long-chain acyl-CoA synthetase